MRARPFLNVNAAAWALALAVLLQCGCSGSDRAHLSALAPAEAWDCNRPFTELPFRYAPGITSAENGIVDNELAWCDLWSRIYASTFPTPPCDRSLADFSREVVLFAAMGEMPTGGYTVKIACVQGDEDAAALRVQVLESRPGPHCIVSLAVTYPISVVKVERPVHGAIFETTEIVQDCPP